MLDSVEKIEALENENTNKEPGSDKAKTSSTPSNPLHSSLGHQLLAIFFPHFVHFLFHPHERP